MQRSRYLGQRSQQIDSFFAKSSSEKPLSRTITPSSSSRASKRNKSGQTYNNVAKISSSKGLDESMMLLAQLEEENAHHLSTNQSPGSDQVPAAKRIESMEKPRPPGTEKEKVSSNDSKPVPLRFSMIPPPPLTDLEFWGALVKDYTRILQRLPSLVLWKMRSGVPAPLRGIVWQTISGARNIELESFYNRVLVEQTSYKGIIDDDSLFIFPGVDLFRDPQGDGQQILKRVLRIFSLYDDKISYSRGLAYIVGPLLIYMGEMQAFCVLVRLMANYNIRDCFLPGYSGLSLRIYQYQQLLKQHLPNLSRHFDDLQIEPTYTLQWFLSFFAVTCPLPMLFRLYDVLFTEGASLTIMRVALSLMFKNEKKLLACKEAQDVTQLLISRGLWDVYHYNADEFINEFTSLDEIVTFEILEELETRYSEDKVSKSISLSKNIASSAAKFLIEPNTYSKLAYSQSNPTEPTQSVALSRRSSSEQSFTYSMNSSNGAGSESMLSSSTALTSISRNTLIIRRSSNLFQSRSQGSNQSLPDKLDELLTTLSELQKENTELSKKIAMEKEERSDDYESVRHLLDRLRKNLEINLEIKLEPMRYSSHDLTSYIERIESQFFPPSHGKSSLEQSKLQLNEELADVKRQLEIEISKTQEFGKQFLEQADEIKSLQQQIKEVHLHIRYAYEEKQRLERVIYEMRMKQQEKEKAYNSNKDLSSMSTDHGYKGASISGLRTFQLRQDGPGEIRNKAPPKQSSEIQAQSNTVSVNLKAEDPSKNKSHTPPESETKSQENENENLIVELVQAKTAEAMAREESDSLRNQLEVLKKSFSANSKNMAEDMARKEAVAREKADDLRSQLEILKKSASVDSKTIAEATAREKAMVKEKSMAQEEVVKLRNQLEALKKSISADSKNMAEAKAREEVKAREEADELRNQLEILKKSASVDSKTIAEATAREKAMVKEKSMAQEEVVKLRNQLEALKKSISADSKNMAEDMARKEAKAREEADELRNQLEILKKSASVDSKTIAEATAREKAMVKEKSMAQEEVVKLRNQLEALKKSISADSKNMAEDMARKEAKAREEADELRNQLEMLKKSASANSKDRSTPEPPTKVKESSDIIETSTMESSGNNLTTDSVRTSVLEPPTDVLSRQSGISSPETKFKVSPNSDPTPQKSTYNSQSTNISRFGLSTNRRVESGRFQSSIRNPELTTSSTNYSSPPISRFGQLLSNRRVESNRFQSTANNPEANRSSVKTSNYTSSRLGYFAKLESRVSQAPDQTIIASNLESSPTSISKSTNSESTMTDANAQKEAKGSAPSNGMGSYFSTSKAELKTSESPYPSPEASPEAITNESSSKFEAKPTAPANKLESFISASKDETNTQKPSEQISKLTSDSEFEPAVNNSTTEFEISIDASDLERGSHFSVSKAKSTILQVSEPTPESKPMSSITNSTPKAEAKSITPAFGLGSFYSASKTETGKPQVFESTPESKPKLEPALNNSTTKSEAKTTASAFGLGSFFSASKNESKTPQVPEQTSEIKPVPATTNTAKTETKSTAPAFGLGGFFSASKTGTKTPQKSEPIPEPTPEPITNNSTAKIETKSTVPAFGLGSFFSASKTETKSPQTPETTPKQTSEPTINNSTTKTETKSSAPAFGFGSFFSASKSETKTPQPSEPTPTPAPPPPKPVVSNTGNGFWGGWGKKS